MMLSGACIITCECFALLGYAPQRRTIPFTFEITLISSNLTLVYNLTQWYDVYFTRFVLLRTNLTLFFNIIFLFREILNRDKHKFLQSTNLPGLNVTAQWKQWLYLTAGQGWLSNVFRQQRLKQKKKKRESALQMGADEFYGHGHICLILLTSNRKCCSRCLFVWEHQE